MTSEIKLKVDSNGLSQTLFLKGKVMSQLLILTNGQALPVSSIVEIDVYESYGNGFRAKIWRTEGCENLFTEWSIDDMKNAKYLKIKITMKTD